MPTGESTIDSEGFKGGTRGSPIMPRDAVSRTANVERTGGHKWVKLIFELHDPRLELTYLILEKHFTS